jgi:hypothetical protein
MESPTEIQTLRILGVQKDNPYAVPGQDVKLTMLWHDGSVPGEHDFVPADGSTPARDTRRKVNIAWLGGCLNPPGDSYSGCYQQNAGALPSTDAGGAGAASPPAGASSGARMVFGTGPTFTVHIPTEAENGAPVLHPSSDPKLPPYGLSYVFFALCAGKIAPGDGHFPIRCVEPDDETRELGSDDFVLGYSSIYIFAPRSDGKPYANANPVNSGLYVGSEKLGDDVVCSGDGCLGSCDDDGCRNPPPVDVNCADTPTLCIPRCPDDGDPNKCPPTNLRLEVNTSKFEKDQVTNDAYGEDYGEQMWIDYYSTRGKFRSGTKLLNDRASGYNKVNGTQFYAPNVPGKVLLWAVMHDNRGGVSWVGTTLSIQ